MRTVLTLAAAIACAASVPAAASAQTYRDDPCRAERHSAGRTGTLAGALVGALIGNQLASHGSRTAGTVIGGGVGAVAGHQIGAHSVSCTPTPKGYSHHQGCHWVQDTYRGHARSYEICQDSDGYWRRHQD